MESQRLFKTLQDEYLSKAKPDILEWEVNRLLDIPFAGSFRSPGFAHPNLSHLQKIMLDLVITYRQGHCELAMLSSRAVLEALINAKMDKPNQQHSLYLKIEGLPLDEETKKEAHIVRMLGNLVAHWSISVEKKRKIKTLGVTLSEKGRKFSFEVQIPPRYVNANENFLFQELMATKSYTALINLAVKLFPAG